MSGRKIVNVKKVLLLGSGGIKIGQAGEFDYSGSQAIKALKEEGIEVILINPNIATVQTDENLADKIYFLPIEPKFVEEIIKKEKPDGILLSFGGQTALNCGVELYNSGFLKKNGVRVLGTGIKQIEETEDRDLFVQKLKEINALTPKSFAVKSVQEAKRKAEQIGYPLMLRSAFALGGQGSGVCKNERELEKRALEALSIAPQILIEEWLGGWKEIEYEVVRDTSGNCITVCNMENFDPLGVHTGESIVVAPSQTLNSKEYFGLRKIALDVIRHIGIVGECNIQYALNPNPKNGELDYRIIEVNARLSRSSALASKATGYPLAYVAAKLALGYSLEELSNAVTKTTTAFFEPALDYCAIKIPRWDLKKFKNVDIHIGSEMKSVGEVMAIGRNFEEAIQKALRMVGEGYEGFSSFGVNVENYKDELINPTDKRIFAIHQAFKKGVGIDKIFKFSKIDKWFLYKLKNIFDMEDRMQEEPLSKQNLYTAKKLGFSDEQIARIKNKSIAYIRTLRKRYGITPFVKQIDTLAGEFPAQTNYLYTTYEASDSDIASNKSSKKKVMILGSGAYRIGSSVEFDWCCVNSAKTAKELGFETIMLNYNPETVSTDYDMSDKLYFDELSLERVLDIYEFEKPFGVIVSMGGQIPNNLALDLARFGVNVLGTDVKDIDRAEDRNKFSALLDSADIDQPEWKEARTLNDAKKFARDVGYPVLIRPSYVLSGAAMNVVYNAHDLEKYLLQASELNKNNTAIVTKFIENSKEIEIDAVAKKGEILAYAISEHIENAGVHSGDATTMLPAQHLYIETIRRVKKIAKKVARELKITGPFNMQFLAYDNHIKVIECNVRASRSFPFASKVFKYNFAELATKAILQNTIEPIEKSAFDLDYVAVKASQFSFSRLKGADPLLGVEMSSTGEVACFGNDVSEALLKALISVGFHIPKKGILVSIGDLVDKSKILESILLLKKTGIRIYTTPGTSEFFEMNGVKTKTLNWRNEDKNSVFNFIKNRKIDWIINIPHKKRLNSSERGFAMRSQAVAMNIFLTTNLQLAERVSKALFDLNKDSSLLQIKSWDEF